MTGQDAAALLRWENLRHVRWAEAHPRMRASSPGSTCKEWT